MADSEGSSHLLDSRRRTRLTLACQRCRRRKIKCDLESPQCASCVKLGVLCIRMEKRAELASRADFRGYLESLEAEVAQLNERATELGLDPVVPSPELEQTLAQSNASPRQDFATTLNSMPSVYSTPLERANTLDRVVDWGNFGELAGSGMSNSSGYADFAFSMKRMIWSATTIDGGHPSNSKKLNRLLPDLKASTSGIKITPAAERYMDAYFDVFGDPFPFLEKQTLRDLLRDVTCSSDDPKGRLSPLLLMVLALGARVSSANDQVSSYHSSVYFLATLESYTTMVTPDSIGLLQLLLLLTLYSMFSPCGGNTWHLLGLAMQTCVRLGLHQESGPALDVVLKKQGNLAFWCTYVLDRCISLTFGRPFGIAEADIGVLVPSEVENSQLNTLSRLAILISSSVVGTSTNLETITQIHTVISSLSNLINTSEDHSGKFPSLTMTLAHSISLYTFNPRLIQTHLPSISVTIQHIHNLINLSASFLQGNWPMPWFLSYAVFHGFLTHVVNQRMSSQENELNASQAENSAEGNIEVAVESVLRAGAASFEELKVLLDLFHDLREGVDNFSSELLDRLNRVPNSATRRLARCVLVLTAGDNE